MKKITRKTLIASLGASAYSFFVGWSFSAYNNIWKVLLVFSIIAIWISLLVSVSFDKERLYKLSLTLAYFGLIIILCTTLIIKSGVLSDISDPNAIVELLKSSGDKGKLIYVAIMILQVTFIPIPSTPVIVAGALIFSNVEAIFLSVIGLLVGSIFAFALGRFFGKKLVTWIVGEEVLTKYRKLIGGKDKAILLLMFMLPTFPDDVLCLVAGMTTMSWSMFIISQLIARPIATASTVYTTEILRYIPLRGWGLVVWGLVLVAIALVFIVVLKKSEQIESAMLKFINRVMGKTSILQVNLDKLEKPLQHQMSPDDEQEEMLDDDGDVHVKMDVPPNNEADVILGKLDDIHINY